MELVTTAEAKVKPMKRKESTVALRIRAETKKKVLQELSKINKKDFGRAVTADEFLSMALKLFQPEHIKSLQEQSLSNQDRFELSFKRFCAENGSVSKDEFLGKLMRGEIRAGLVGQN